MVTSSFRLANPKSKQVLFLLFGVFLVFTALVSTRSGARLSLSLPTPDLIVQNYSRLPLNFEQNEGQVDANVQFLARGQGYNLFLMASEAVLSLRQPLSLVEQGSANPEMLSSVAETKQAVEQTVIRMRLVGANPAPAVSALEQLPGKVNYFIGNNPDRWRTEIPTFAKVTYEDIYPGVDLMYYGHQGRLEYDFVVKPGANLSDITLSFEGADRLELDRQGNIELHIGDSRVVHKAPIIYQDVEDERREIEGRFVLHDGGQVGFHLGTYDASRPVVIDPELIYSTFLGGMLDSRALAITVDNSNNTYLTGFTNSMDFPLMEGAPQTVLNGNSDAYVAKLNGEGSALIFATYLGGGLEENVDDSDGGIAVDMDGNVYVAGRTESDDFPTFEALQTTLRGVSDAFLAKLDPTGSSLIYATYLGGSAVDTATGLEVDGNGNAYLAGWTASSDFPTTAGAFEPIFNGTTWTDAFVTKVNAAGDDLLYSTFVGGTGRDEAYGMDLHTDGSVYITGATFSFDDPGSPVDEGFPVSGDAFQPVKSESLWDAFVARLSPDGEGLVYGSYLGGSGGLEWGHDVAVDVNGNAYLTGETRSVDDPGTGEYEGFPITAGVFQPGFGGDFNDAYVAKVSPDGSALLYSSYIGGNAGDTGLFGADLSIGVDSAGSAYLAGSTKSTDFPIANAFQPELAGGVDVFVTKVSPDGSNLEYSSYLGANEDEFALDIEVDALGNAYITGYAPTGFPTTPGAYQETSPGIIPAFVAKIGEPPAEVDLSRLAFATYFGGNDTDRVADIVVDVQGAEDHIYITGYTPSTDFPAVPAPVTVFGERGGAFPGDAYAAKFTFDGSSLSLDWISFLAGSDGDAGLSVSLDAVGDIYLAGHTRSANFPTTANALKSSPPQGEDAFFAKLSSDGTQLLYSTLLGGGADDNALDLFVDETGTVYLAGDTHSTDFPTTAAAPGANFPDESFNGGGDHGDAFVAKLVPSDSGFEYVYASYLGGSDSDAAYGIAADGVGNAYVVGETRSTNFPIKNAPQELFGGVDDGFVTKINPNGSDFVYSTYLGGEQEDDALEVVVDDAGHAYVAGKVRSENFQTPQSCQPSNKGDFDIFVAKLEPEGMGLTFCTFIGGSNRDESHGIDVDAAGKVYVLGRSESPDFPLVDPLQQIYGGGSIGDLVIVVLDTDGSSLSLSTYLGGTGNEGDNRIDVDSAGNAFIVGRTGSVDFPLSNAIQSVYGGGEFDGIVAKIQAPNLPPSVSAAGPYEVDEGDSMLLAAVGDDPDDDTLTFEWDLDGNGTYETPGQEVTFSAAGLDGPSSHTVGVRVTDGGGLTSADETTVDVTNADPTAAFANTSGSIIQGESATLVFSNVFDPSLADTIAGFLYAFDCTDDGVFELADTVDTSFECPYPASGAFTAKGMITDKDGGATPYLASVTVLTPVEAAQELVEQIEALNLQQSFENILNAVFAVLDDMNENNDKAACNALNAFINAVETPGTNLTDDQVIELVDLAQSIKDSLSCAE